jgi:hypothetical protein
MSHGIFLLTEGLDGFEKYVTEKSVWDPTADRLVVDEEKSHSCRGWQTDKV